MSMNKRYGTDFDEGLRVWREYSLRFIENSGRINVFIFDFNRFCREPAASFAKLLNWLGRPADPETLRDNIASFWSAPASALPDSDCALPDDVQKLYSDLKELAFNAKPRIKP
jgi:hypothetical protein